MAGESGSGNERLDRGTAPGAVNHTNGNIELQMQAPGEHKGHARKPVHGLRGAHHPVTTIEITLRNGRVALVHFAVADGRIVRLVRQCFAFRQATGHAVHLVVHVGLPTGKPYVTNQYVLNLYPFATGTDFQGTSLGRGLHRFQFKLPATFLVRLAFNRLTGKGHRHGSSRIRLAPNGNRGGALQYHVVGKYLGQLQNCYCGQSTTESDKEKYNSSEHEETFYLFFGLRGFFGFLILSLMIGTSSPSSGWFQRR